MKNIKKANTDMEYIEFGEKTKIIIKKDSLDNYLEIEKQYDELIIKNSLNVQKHDYSDRIIYEKK